MHIIVNCDNQLTQPHDSITLVYPVACWVLGTVVAAAADFDAASAAAFFSFSKSVSNFLKWVFKYCFIFDLVDCDNRFLSSLISLSS